MSELKPCPFCDGERIGVYWITEHDLRVRCMGCLVRGPIAHTEDEAIDLWNTRAIDTPTTPAAPDCCLDCSNRIAGDAKCKKDRDQCQQSPDVCKGVAEGLHTAPNKCGVCCDFKQGGQNGSVSGVSNDFDISDSVLRVGMDGDTVTANATPTAPDSPDERDALFDELQGAIQSAWSRIADELAGMVKGDK